MVWFWKDFTVILIRNVGVKNVMATTGGVNGPTGVDNEVYAVSGSGSSDAPGRGIIIKAQYLRDIDVPGTNCGISGMVVVCSNRFVFTDSVSECMILLNLDNNQVLAQLNLPCIPMAISKVKSDATSSQVVVAMPGKLSVAFITIRDDSLSIDRNLAIGLEDGIINGIDCEDDKLAVVLFGNDDSQVQLLDLQGSVLYRFRNRRMRYIGNPTFSEDGTHIYVSGVKHVFCLNLHGKIVAKYKDRDLQGAVMSLVDSSGDVLVCGLDSHNIHQITKSCKKVQVLLTEADGINTPRHICLSEDKTRLYVAMRPDKVKVYILERTDSTREKEKIHKCSIQ